MRLTRFFGVSAMLFTLAACSAPAANTPATSPAAPAPATAVAAPTLAPSAATSAPATVADAPTLAPSAAATAGLDALPTSKTAEGYQSLGDPNAPLTLTMYSDFL